MKFLKVFLLLIITFLTNAHVLPHQASLTNQNCQINPELTLTTLDENDILYWYNTGNTHPITDTDFIDSLPENMLGDDATGVIVYNEDGEIVINKSILSCSIYVDPGHPIFPLCGEDDHFMLAAQAAINNCAARKGKVPYFVGPQNFLDALNETTSGVHHQNYNESDGIGFICIEFCSTSNEAIE